MFDKVDLQSSTGNRHGIVQHVLYERVILFSATLDGVQRWDDISQSSSARTATCGQDAKLEVAVS